MLFKTGKIVMTRGVATKFYNNDMFRMEVLVDLNRHENGDWGDICLEDKQTNNMALLHNYRIFSEYKTTEGKIYIITEWDRSYTTILFPDEY